VPEKLPEEKCDLAERSENSLVAQAISYGLLSAIVLVIDRPFSLGQMFFRFTTSATLFYAMMKVYGLYHRAKQARAAMKEA
jgi:hypothetical protein